MNNFKHILFASLLMASLSATAQETYQDSKLAENQLTGTARYVGMGGAMEALGADISTISTPLKLPKEVLERVELLLFTLLYVVRSPKRLVLLPRREP